MTDLISEVKHELQQEKLLAAIKQYYKGAIALFVVIVVVVSLYVYKHESNVRELEGMSEEYYKLFMSEHKISTVKEGTFGKLTVFDKTIYSKLAKLQYVNLLIQSKESGKALQLLFDLIADPKVPIEIANLAKIKASELVMKYKIKGYNEKVIDILQKATRKTDVPYFYMLKLLLGQLLIEDNQKDEALDVLRSLNKDEKTPNNIKFFSNAILENHLK
jgi:hypothetical protein